MTARPAAVIGGGLAGLSAAVRLAGRGYAPVVSEAAARAGGRCRSYYDRELDLTIDNGNHLVLSGNRDVASLLAETGSAHALRGPETARLAFADLASGKRWAIRPNPGPLAWWILDPRRRPPGAGLAEHLAMVKLALAPRSARVDACVRTEGALWDRLLGPFLLAALNLAPGEGSAGLAGAVIRESLARGGRAYRARIAHPTLAAAFVDPAVRTIAARGGEVRFGRRLRRLVFEGERVTGLDFGDAAPEPVAGPVILAAPAWVARDLVPGLVVPERHCAIVNAHFRMTPPPGLEPITGVIGGLIEWVFVFEDRISVTISGADRLLERDRDALEAEIWAETAKVLGIDAPRPVGRIIVEKRATFAATPEEDARRPPAQTRWRNLFLAGDWTDTGLPATIEGAIRSGFRAAALAARGG